MYIFSLSAQNATAREGTHSRLHTPIGMLVFSIKIKRFFTGLNLLKGNIDDQYYEEAKIGVTDITCSMSNSITEKLVRYRSVVQ